MSKVAEPKPTRAKPRKPASVGRIVDSGSAKKADHIHLRAASWQKAIIKAGAEAAGAMQVTEYVLHAAIDRAERDILEKSVFAMGSPAWSKFMAELDAPPKVVPELKRLFRSKDVFAPRVQSA